jgi:integrase/recombinase XerD
MPRLHPVAKELVNIINRHRLTYRSFNECCKLARQHVQLRPPHRGRTLPQLLPPTSLSHFYAVIDKAGDLQHQIMLRLLFYTAIRVSELVSIEVHNVNLSDGRIFINQGKGDKDRVVLFPDSFRLTLQAHLAANPENRYLFESRRKTKYTTRRIEQIVQEYAAAAELPFHIHPHLLRHQMLTHLTKSGLTDAQIQLVSGHASKQSLEIYQHLSVESAVEDYQKAVKGIGI